MPNRDEGYTATTMTPFQGHCARWKDCTACPLCTQRSRIVLARGSIPCDILLIGEAPGDSEDATGVPFIGPAGHKLDYILSRAGIMQRYKLAYTNLVACFPKEAKQTGDHRPPVEAIRACEPRLKEFVRLCRPTLIVLVGDLAKRHVSGQAQFCEPGEDNHPHWIPEGKFLEFVDIVHPSAILQANEAQKGLMQQRAIVTLTNRVAKVFGAK